MKQTPWRALGRREPCQRVDKEMVTQLTESFLPGSLRADVIINDMAVSNPDFERQAYPFEEVAIPTLIFHAKDDRWGAFAKAKEAADRIPECTFVRSSQVDICYSGADKQSARKSHSSYASTHGPRRLQEWRLVPK